MLIRDKVKERDNYLWGRKKRFGLKIEKDDSPSRAYLDHYIIDRKNGVRFNCSKQHEMRLVVKMLNEAVGQGNYGYGMKETSDG